MKKTISVMNALFLLVSLSINVMADPNEFGGYVHNGGSACKIEEDIDDGCLECYIKRQVMKQVAKQLEDTKQQFSSQIEEIKNQRVPSKCFCFDSPVGEIIAFGGINGTRVDSAGYILCDGKELSVLEYPDLFQAIGTIYGASGTNFNVPDLRGVFLRGTGGNAAPLGQKQGDAIRNIVGGWTSYHEEATNAYGALKVKRAWGNGVCGNCGSNDDVVFDASGVVPTANENRPLNYAVNYYIKATDRCKNMCQND